MRSCFSVQVRWCITMYALVAAYLLSFYLLPLHGDRPVTHLRSRSNVESYGVAKIEMHPMRILDRVQRSASSGAPSRRWADGDGI